MTVANLSNNLMDLLEVIHKTATLDRNDAMSLPPEAFTSAQLLAMEREIIFSKEWICVGREDELTSPGDYFTTEVNQVPLIIVCSEDNNLRALVNVCRHRMAKIVENQGKTRVFTCSYHAWSYDLNGKLVNAPNMENTRFTKTNCQLPEVRLEVWQGFIYVNLDNKAEPLLPRLQSFTDQIKHYRVDQMTSVWKKKLTWKTNWKVLVENFLEMYHIPTVHRETLLPYGGNELCKPLAPGDGYNFYIQGQETNHELYGGIIAPEVRIENPELTEFELFNTFVGCIYPNHLMSISWFGVLWLVLHPTKPGEIQIDWGVVGPLKGLPVNSDNYNEYSYPVWIDQVNQEDKPRVEAVQRGAESGYAQAGPLHTKHEGTVFEFIRYLSRKLKGSQTQ